MFPIAEYWWLYGGFTVFVLLMLAIDLGVFHRRAHEVTVREALRWSAVWITLALLFNGLVYAYAATGNRMSVKLASNLSDATSAKTQRVMANTPPQCAWVSAWSEAPLEGRAEA